ncbi:MAG TPA: winged helix DNA-binding domain-containing protein [Actinomycetota bacterium]|nr:winged helix DNA-binding domain-containing protein [Actinomycetota bacterium]
MPTPPDDAVLDRRTLNRALLERHLLLHRRRVPVADALERLVGLQSQVPRDPYVALWSRLDRFRPSALADPMAERRALRMTLLRGTLHTVTDRDALALYPAVRPAIDRVQHVSSPLRSAIGSVDRDELVSMIRVLLEERARTRADLAEALAERWPDKEASSLAFGMYLLPIVQVTPRGIWGQTGSSAFTTLEAWLGRPVDGSGDTEALLLRYLARFGPATVADAQTWSGLQGLKGAFEALRPRLRTFRDERGRELFDVPDGALPDPGVPAPVRFLPEYDNVGLGHKDRSRIIPDGVVQWTEVGWGGVLVGGFAAARWRLWTEGGRATLRVETFGRLRREDRAEVVGEGERLAAFLAPDADRRDVRFGAFDPDVARR